MKANMNIPSFVPLFGVILALKTLGALETSPRVDSSSSQIMFCTATCAYETNGRGALCIPAFERAHPVPPLARDESRFPLDEEDYNYENVEWTVVPDFVDKVR